MTEAWSTPWRDLRRRFSRRGRAELRAKRVLVELVEERRDDAGRLALETALALDRDDLARRFVEEDDAETARVREELLDDLSDLYPGVPRTELLGLVGSFRTLARDLPVEREETPP